MYVVTLSVFHNLAIWLLYVNKPEPDKSFINYGLLHYQHVWFKFVSEFSMLLSCSF